jgi:DNA mismatch repair protein MSH6
MRDENQRDPNDPEYDPSTLYIPEKEYSKMPKTIHQYWKIKSKNFDKIVAFKVQN